MKKKKIAALMAFLLTTLSALATINPTATYTDSSGTLVTDSTSFTANAPLHVLLEANASNLEAGSTLEWHFSHQGAGGGSDVTRYEENTEYDFTESGVTVVTLMVRLNDEVVEEASLSVTISESVLEMPNAFSPNDDGYNDYYNAKSTAQSIVEFHGYIFNRWGQKLYDWTDWTEEKSGWDGTYNGSPVKDGVYFCLVKARGADGREYNIRRSVTLIRKYNTEGTTGGGDEQ